MRNLRSNGTDDGSDDDYYGFGGGVYEEAAKWGMVSSMGAALIGSLGYSLYRMYYAVSEDDGVND
jgi:hypothetical protein